MDAHVACFKHPGRVAFLVHLIEVPQANECTPSNVLDSVRGFRHHSTLSAAKAHSCKPEIRAEQDDHNDNLSSARVMRFTHAQDIIVGDYHEQSSQQADGEDLQSPHRMYTAIAAIRKR